MDQTYLLALVIAVLVVMVALARITTQAAISREPCRR